LCTALADGIEKATGVRPAAKSDFLYGDQVAGEYEILIGETNRAESAEVYKDLKYNDYKISVIGSKVVIAGGSYEAQKKAVEDFVSLFSDGKLSLPAVTEYNSTYERSDIKIDGESINKYRLVYSSPKALVAVNLIRTAVGEISGVRLPIDKHNAAQTEYEIVVGETNRNHGIACDYYAYKITTSGKSVFINSYDIPALNAAAHKLIDGLIGTSGDVSLASLAYDYKVPTNAEMAENIDLLYMRWAEDWQPPEGMLDYEAKKKAIVNVSDRLMSCAHRADSYYYPENSLPSVISFYKMGGDVVELDVMATKDDVIILMHDTTLGRMTNAEDYVGQVVNGVKFPNSYNVADWTYEQIQYLYLKEGWGGANAKLTSFKIPTLTEVLKACKNRMFILPDKAQAGNGGQWRYADIPGVQNANRNVFLYDSMVEANNYESIILSYGYLSAYEAVTVQKWIQSKSGVAPLIIVRNNSASGVQTEYEFLVKKAVPNTFAVHIGGAYSESFASTYASAYDALKDKVLIHGWTILYTNDGKIDYDADNVGTWQTMYDLGYRMIMGNNYLKLVQFAATTCNFE